MNQTDYIVSSDLMAGLVAVTMNELCSRGVSNAMLWKPFVESALLSVVGRMGESYFMLARKGIDDKTVGVPYIRSETGRSSLVILLSSLIVSYVMKQKFMGEAAIYNVSADIIGQEITNALFASDSVWWAK
jgi:hypothetical protein